MNTENNAPSNMIMPEPAHQEHHHRRIVIVVAIILAVLVIGGIAFQLLSSRKGTALQDAILRQEYQNEENAMSQKIFEDHAFEAGITAEEAALNEEVFKKYSQPEGMSESELAELQEDVKRADDLQEAKYQEWKKARSAN